MIELKEVLLIHSQVISSFGGVSGVRDYNLLESAIGRPKMTFSDVELYPEIEDKAAAILESIVKNHPFLDGNKRTGYVLMRYVLIKSGKDIDAKMADKLALVMSVAEGKSSFKEIRDWIKKHMILLK